jgi:hypothetical protein
MTDNTKLPDWTDDARASDHSMSHTANQRDDTTGDTDPHDSPHVPHGGDSVPEDGHGDDRPVDSSADHGDYPGFFLREEVVLSSVEKRILAADQQNLQWLSNNSSRYDYLFITITFKSSSSDGTQFLSLFDGWLHNRICRHVVGRNNSRNSHLNTTMTVMREFECNSSHRLNCPAHIHAIVGVPKHPNSMRRLRKYLPRDIKTKPIIHDIDIQECVPGDLGNRYRYMRKTHRREMPFAGRQP